MKNDGQLYDSDIKTEKFKNSKIITDEVLRNKEEKNKLPGRGGGK